MEAYVAEARQQAALVLHVRGLGLEPVHDQARIAEWERLDARSLADIVSDHYHVLASFSQFETTHPGYAASLDVVEPDAERLAARKKLAELGPAEFNRLTCALCAFLNGESFSPSACSSGQLPSDAPNLVGPRSPAESPVSNMISFTQNFSAVLENSAQCSSPLQLTSLMARPCDTRLEFDRTLDIDLPLAPYKGGDVHGKLYYATCAGEYVVIKALGAEYSLRRASILDKYLASIPTIDHPNVQEDMGLFAHSGTSILGIVRPWVEFDVLEYLQRGQGDFLSIAEKVADALVVLHEGAGIVHGGVHPGNVLVSSSGGVVLCDAGIRAAVRRLLQRPRPSADHIRYMAPELVSSNDAEATRASDVYSFAMLLSQLCDSQLVKPFEDRITEAEVAAAIANGTRPRLNMSAPELATLRSLLVEAMDRDPHQRPPMRDISNAITRALSRRAKTGCTRCTDESMVTLQHINSNTSVMLPAKKKASSQLSSPPSSPPRNSLGLANVSA